MKRADDERVRGKVDFAIGYKAFLRFCSLPYIDGAE